MRQQKEIEAHMHWCAQHTGEREWQFREIWNADDGWRVEWVAAGASLVLDPIACLQMCRLRLKELKSRKAKQMAPEFVDQASAFFSAMKAMGKECLLRNRIKAIPARDADMRKMNEREL
jgi:hypothetical protein